MPMLSAVGSSALKLTTKRCRTSNSASPFLECQRVIDRRIVADRDRQHRTLLAADVQTGYVIHRVAERVGREEAHAVRRTHAQARLQRVVPATRATENVGRTSANAGKSRAPGAVCPGV